VVNVGGASHSTRSQSLSHRSMISFRFDFAISEFEDKIHIVATNQRGTDNCNV
jgi:hypothetical protein